MPSPAALHADFEPIGKRVTITSGSRIIDAVRQAGIELTASCGGDGNCGQCRVMIMFGDVSPPDTDEIFFLTPAELQQGLRLACRAIPLSDVKIHIPADSLVTGQRLQVEGQTRQVEVQSAVCALEVQVPAPGIQDGRGDLERTLAALQAASPQLDPAQVTASLPVLSQLADVARRQAWNFTAYVRSSPGSGSEIVGTHEKGRPPLGLAIDLGTTKIAAMLVDLHSGEVLNRAGAMNPQISYGEDVISRLKYALHTPTGGEELTGKVRQALDDLAQTLLQPLEFDRQQIVEAVVVGNTAMTHLLLGLPVRQLALAPYVASTNLALDVRTADLGLHLAPGAYLHVLPGVGGFVGGDHVAMILASELDQAGKLRVGLDIGTNTEIVLTRPNGEMLSAACASGPAFEGAHIGDGMRAAAGAIEAVRLTSQGPRLKTIDDAPAVGLCGSGIVDTIAELRRCGLLTPNGRLQAQDPRLRGELVRPGRHGPELLLAPAALSGSQRDVTLTQKDIEQIQLAKGAIRAGLDALLHTAGASAEEVAEVTIAGAFGSYLDVQSALDIGLLPHWPNATYRQIGNAAAEGAYLALVSLPERRRASEIAQRIQYVELTTFPQFNRLFAYGMRFPADTELLVVRTSSPRP